MKITSSQLKQIIKEEILMMKEGLSRSGSLKRRSKINEKRLFENSAAGDIRNTAEALTDACVAFASDSMNPAAMNSFNEELYNHITSVLSSYGVVSSFFTAKELMKELSRYDSVSLKDAKDELASACSGEFDTDYSAIATYADSVATLVINAYRDRGISDEVESPDKLLPEF